MEICANSPGNRTTRPQRASMEVEMKVLMTTTAALSFLALTLPAAPALANFDGCHWVGFQLVCPNPEPVEPDCDCIPDALDVLQNLTAAQKATNRIDDFKTVQNVV